MKSASSDDEDVVEQSLMQLDPVSGETSDEDEEGELHILMLNPESLLDDPDISHGQRFSGPMHFELRTLSSRGEWSAFGRGKN